MQERNVQKSKPEVLTKMVSIDTIKVIANDYL